MMTIYWYFDQLGVVELWANMLLVENSNHQQSVSEVHGLTFFSFNHEGLILFPFFILQLTLLERVIFLSAICSWRYEKPQISWTFFMNILFVADKLFC